MKTAKKAFAVLLVVMMVAALGTTAFAATGSVTVSNPYPGETYTLFKLFNADVTNGKITYTLPAGKTAADITGHANANQWFEVNGTQVKAKPALTASAVSSGEFRAWAKSFGTQVGASLTAAAGTPVQWPAVDYGYYYLESSLGIAISVDSVNGADVSVMDKNNEPTFTKTVGSQPANSVSLNQIVPFSISATAMNYQQPASGVGTGPNRKVVSYKVVDTMSAGWTITNPPTVAVNGSPVSVTPTYTPAGATMATATGFELVIPWVDASGNLLYADGSTLEISYAAKLDPAKLPNGPAVGTNNSYTNDATVSWTLDDGTVVTPTIPGGVTPGTHTDTYETSLTVNKKDGNSNVLTGAQFTLTGTSNLVTYTSGNEFVADAAGTYWKLLDGSYTQDDPDTLIDPADPASGYKFDRSKYASLTDKYKEQAVSAYQGAGQTNTSVSAFVNAQGVLVFSGLGEGTYKLSETVFPAGYNKAADVNFKIKFDPATKTYTVTDLNDQPLKDANGNDIISVNATNGLLSTNVVNVAGSTLPSTGGIGTTIFYVLGSCLLLGAAVLLITRKRMKSEG